MPGQSQRVKVSFVFESVVPTLRKGENTKRIRSYHCETFANRTVKVQSEVTISLHLSESRGRPRGLDIVVQKETPAS